MASRLVLERIPLKTLQLYHHKTFNLFTEHENLVDAISNRPGFSGSNPIGYLSIASRRKGIHRQDLEDTIINDRFLVRVPAFRSSLMLLHAKDYGVYYRALGPLRQSKMEQLSSYGIQENTMAKLGHILENADLDFPATGEQILALLLKPLRITMPTEHQRLLIRKLCDFGILIRTSAKGWKGNEFTYHLTSKWIPDIPLVLDNPESARIETTRRYLTAYGPSSLGDVSWWTGFSTGQVQRAISHLKRDCARFFVDGIKEELFGIRDSADFLKKKHVDVANPILFLPPLDPFMLAWAKHERIVDAPWEHFVYDSYANPTSVILYQGKVIGLWQFREHIKGVLELHVFQDALDKRGAVFDKAEKHALFLGKLAECVEVDIAERALPEKTLKEREGGSFLWPLLKDIKEGDEKQKNGAWVDRRGNMDRAENKK